MYAENKSKKARTFDEEGFEIVETDDHQPEICHGTQSIQAQLKLLEHAAGSNYVPVNDHFFLDKLDKALEKNFNFIRRRVLISSQIFVEEMEED